MISKSEYQQRRAALAKQLGPGTIALIPAASERLRNGDAHYRFRQDSDFYYLTGFEEADALLVIVGSEPEQCILFNQKKDKQLELWTGSRLGQEAAIDKLGVAAAYPLEKIKSKLAELLAEKQSIHYPIGRYPHWDKCIQKAWHGLKEQVRRGIKAPDHFVDLAPSIAELRLIKSAAEIALMQKAAMISVAAHARAMQSVRSLSNEYALEAELLYEFYRQGCRAPAYDSIVAAGTNACVLHYTANNQPLQAGQLVLIDAAGEYQNYAADITRTFPVDGRFRPEQSDLYNLVLEAQKAGIAMIRPGTRWNEVQQCIIRVLTQGLLDLGILQGQLEHLLQQEAYKPFYMHNSGHWLGLDVHDAGAYKIAGEWRPLQAGMLLTVEPGLYIPEDIESVPERFRGIGIRIEDDILVVPEGHSNLTAALPREVKDIEALVGG